MAPVNLMSYFTASLAPDHIAMFRLLLSGFARAGRLWLTLPVSPWTEGRSPGRAFMLFLAWPLFVVLQLLNWLGLGIDEILFRRWRRIQVREPLFVLGPPRSGTTHLHHVLAADPDATTFRTWECLFGLSISARRLILLLIRLDRTLGQPGRRMGKWIGRRFFGDLDQVHPLSLEAPEEDFLVLMPALECFVLIAVFPRADWLWYNARLDRDASAGQRRRLMRFYRACVQKHLFVFGFDESGREKKFLSKNASFSGSAEALLETFPDARILACNRSPLKTVPSQLSALRPGLTLAGFRQMPVRLRDQLVELLHDYYQHLTELARRDPDRLVIVDNEDLKLRLAETVAGALEQLGRPPGEIFRKRLVVLASESRGFRSGHHYTLKEFDLNAEQIEQRFAPFLKRCNDVRGSGNA